MSLVTRLPVLVLASTAFAAAHRHGHAHLHQHQHLHSTGTGTGAPFPYPTGNATGIWGSTGLSYPSTSAAAAGYGTSDTTAALGTATETQYHTETIYTTIHLARQSGAAAASGDVSGAAVDSCGVVTVTQTEQVTAYVTEGSTPSSSTEVSPVESSPAPSVPAYASSSEAYSAPAYSSSEAAPVSTSSASTPSAPAYTAPASSSSSEAAPVSTSHPVAQPYTKVHMGQSASTVAALAATTASTTSSAPPTYTSSASSGGKRGLAYNDASLTSCFQGAREVSWAYNWGSSSNGLNGDFTFIPTLWGTGSDFVGSWSANAKSAIKSGSTHLFSFNEPDHPAQANLAPAAAAVAYQTLMNPFKGQAQLCAPAVTNGGGAMGLTWLGNFLDSCGSACHIDCINIHWYDSASNIAYFKSHVENAIALANGKPIFISEFGATGSDEEISSFLQEVMPWMDSNSNIAGYAYFMVSDGLLLSGSSPSTYGSTFKSYTS